MRILPHDRKIHGSGPIRISVGDDSWSYIPSNSPKMRATEERALRVASSDETVLLLGETGVGKDALARLIHENSSRRGKAFVHVNCAALPEGLLESELFGVVRGAYTGATDSFPGKFELASGGTLFLDEIGEIPPSLQAKLLHVLQERKIQRLGGRWGVNVDVRILAATNRNLRQDLRTGAFRADLFYRLGVITLQIPPLRDRPEDLRSLAKHFLRRYASLHDRLDEKVPDAQFLRLLYQSRWEGNVRELENAVKRYILLGEAESAAPLEAEPIRLEPSTDSGGMLHPTESSRVSLKSALRVAIEKVERRAISHALDRTCWNRTQAARELKISYRSLQNKIKSYDLRPGRNGVDGT